METSKSGQSANQNKKTIPKIKRTKALNNLALFLFASYILIVCLSFLYGGNAHKIWFSVFLGFAGIYMTTRASFFHLDSNYLLGIIFIGFAFISSFQFFYSWAFFDTLYFSWLSFTLLVLYFIFRQNIYLILFALSVCEVLLLIINKLFLNIFLFVSLQAVLIMITFIVFIAVTKIKKEKKGAISNSQKRL